MSSLDSGQVAIVIRNALQSGITLENIARDLGKLAARDNLEQLPIIEPMLFNSSVGLNLENAYRAGIIYIERLKLELQGKL